MARSSVKCVAIVSFNNSDTFTRQSPKGTPSVTSVVQ